MYLVSDRNRRLNPSEIELKILKYHGFLVLLCYDFFQIHVTICFLI